jgi:RNA polymerase sigma factor (sigma-70 family)
MTPPMKPDEETLKTSWTLVARLKNVDDNESWQEFYEVYRRLIVGVALRAGLQEEEARDVMQETMRSFSEHIQDGKFVADAAHGSLRAWLLNMARWRIQDQLRKRLPVAAGSGAPPNGTATTPTVERVPDPREVDLEGLCDAEWKEQVMEQARGKLQLQVKAEHYQIFHLLTAEEKSVAEVANMVGHSKAQIYVVKHRVTRALKKIVKRLERELG